MRLTVKGTCSSAHPAVALKVGAQSLNIQSQSEDFEQNRGDVRRDMKELVVEATDQKQNRRTIIIPIIAQGGSGQPPRSSAAKYALIVGISNYGDAKGVPPALPQAAADAGSMARDLEAKAGFKKDNIRLLRDDAANRDALRIGFYDFAAKAQANDLLVIYVAGRAMHDPQPGNNEIMYLAPFGTQMKAMDSTAISFLDLEMWLDQSVRCNHTFIVFDVGHEVEGDWKFPGPNLVNNHLLSLFSEQKGRAVLTSGSAGDVALNRPGRPVAFIYLLADSAASAARPISIRTAWSLATNCSASSRKRCAKTAPASRSLITVCPSATLINPWPSRRRQSSSTANRFSSDGKAACLHGRGPVSPP